MTAPAPLPDRLDPDADPRLERLLCRLLRGGVILSAILLIVGLVVLFARDDRGALSDPLATAGLDRFGAVFPHTLSQVFAGLRHFTGESVIALGLLILIATPVLRVAVSILAFARARDWPYVAFTGYVLAMLIVSFLVGKAG